MGSGVVFVDISSDEEDCGVDKPRGGDGALDWFHKFFDVEDAGEGKGKSDEVIVVDEFSAPAPKRRKESNSPKAKRGGLAAGDGGDDDDCLILEVDPDGPVATADGRKAAGGIEDDELLIVAEKGELACRDYPHPRHSCVSFPFDSTSHEDHCNLCHCYVCDSLAPCKYWGNGSLLTDHCHSTDKDDTWKELRHNFKQHNMASSQSQKLLDNIRLPCQNQVSSQCFPRPVFSSTSNLRPTVLQPCSRINLAELGSMTQGHYARHSIFSQCSRPDLHPAISRQSSVETGFMQKECHIVNPPRAPVSVSRTRYKRGGTICAGYSNLPTKQHHNIHSINKHMQNNVLERTSLVKSANVSMDYIRSTQSRSYSVPSAMQRSQYESVIDGSKSWQEILASVASDLGVSSSTSMNITAIEQPVAISVQSLPYTQEHPQTNTIHNVNLCGQTVQAVGDFPTFQELRNNSQGENIQQSSRHLVDTSITDFSLNKGKIHLDNFLYAVEQELFSL